MKNLLLVVCIFLIHNINAQKAPVLTNKTIRISTPKMNVDPADPNTVLLKMEFNGSIPRNELNKIKLSDVATISLVYTRYRQSELFSQMNLNAQRMDQLYSLVPALKENKNIQWYWVEQTGCENPGTCTDYFHGFVFTMKSETERLKRESEFALLDYYSSMYDGKPDPTKVDSLIEAGKLTIIKICTDVEVRTSIKGNKMARIIGWTEKNNAKLEKFLRKEMGDATTFQLDLIMDEKGQLSFLNPEIQLAKSNSILRLLNENLIKSPAKYKNKKIRSEVTVKLEVNDKKLLVNSVQTPILPNGDTFILDDFLYSTKVEKHCEYVDTSTKAMRGTTGLTFAPDIVTKVFNRNKQWKNCLVATDVTGSMYPYLAQFQHWHKVHLKASTGNHDFVFFNDGNDKPDYLKTTGSVGGIYYIKTAEFEKLSATMSSAMRNGSGGDGPENNIEALIEGLKRNPGCKEVIMIADNNATPRDLSLLSQVNVPIRLIVCGASNNKINSAYLEMVRKNKGSIHTIEKDIYDLGKMAEGDIIEIEGTKYKLNAGRFQSI